eukprot:TRINITY_DN10384_c0_g2_i1.p2 TRINITY_DN10384_c0_g2~~TRINITY_DN10384_c0_g2_i1.p2  ORF type:complete len:324 (+),score=105.16 TRINITY_DN10384_c0_g2_i1:35-973(+)
MAEDRAAGRPTLEDEEAEEALRPGAVEEDEEGGGREDVAVEAGAAPVPVAGEDVVQVLGCQQCKLPLVTGEDILVEKTDFWAEQVYQYDLDLDILPVEIACYSSTNPAGIRFDVVRTKPSKWMALHGMPVAEHSWFPKHAWTGLACGRCDNHLGWAFSPVFDAPASAAVAAGLAALVAVAAGRAPRCRNAVPQDDTFDVLPTVDFYGLILTRLSPLKLTHAAIEEQRRTMHDEVPFDPHFDPRHMLRDVVALVRQLRDATEGRRADAGEGNDEGPIDNGFYAGDEGEEMIEEEDVEMEEVEEVEEEVEGSAD